MLSNYRGLSRHYVSLLLPPYLLPLKSRLTPVLRVMQCFSFMRGRGHLFQSIFDLEREDRKRSNCKFVIWFCAYQYSLIVFTCYPQASLLCELYRLRRGPRVSAFWRETKARSLESNGCTLAVSSGEQPMFTKHPTRCLELCRLCWEKIKICQVSFLKSYHLIQQKR